MGVGFMGVDLMGVHLFLMVGDIDVLFATISHYYDTGSRSCFKNFLFLKVVYSTLYSIIA